MQTAIRQNPRAHPSLEYFVDVDLSRSTVKPKQVTIGVHRSPDSTRLSPTDKWRSLYWADVAGFRLESGNLHYIEQMVSRLLPALTNFGRLPDYVFIARRSQRIYPVYTIGDEVVATTPGGPTFRHVELAKVRSYLTDYMTVIGELGGPGRSDKLHVRGVSHHTLALLRPVFYLKKRVSGQVEFWAPVFEAEDGRSIYAFVASAKREVSKDQGHEVMALRHICAQALIADRRLSNPLDLRVDRLMAGYWSDVQLGLKPEPYKLAIHPTADSCPRDIPVYRNGRALVAVEPRPREERWGLFLGEGAEDLRQRVAQDYLRRGVIDNLESVKVRATG